ncbi:MAG: hypothetical protein ABSF26_16470 [Thermoguttaceae bacterium]|jgi:hypothetical protein
MRHGLIIMAAALGLALMAGCASQQHPPCNGSCPAAATPCQGGDPAAGCPAGQGRPAQAAPAAGGTVAYPYYTTRGPRDFLESNPQSIGP